MNDQHEYSEEKPASSIAKIVPALILISVLGGFLSLAIYAYQAGRQTVTAEGELMVVEADKSPVKEKPADPGGMQFPNQDKTIFETFSPDGTQQPKVERVLPTPEEPIAKDADDAAPTTWINDKLANNASVDQPAKKADEQVFGKDTQPATAAPVQTVTAATDTPAAVEPAAPSKVVNVREELGKQAVAEPVNLAPPVEKPVAVKKETFAPEKVAEKAVAKKMAEKAPAAAKQMVQLGAFHSEGEARTEFGKMQKKYAALASLSPTVNRADLGEKGVFYRLRVATADAKALCGKLAGQACMVVKQ